MENLTGKKFNQLTVLKYVRSDKYYNSYWSCMCDCGNEIIVTAGRLRSGHTKSCGCYMKERSKEICISRTKHGKRKTRLYNIWCNIKSRCCNPNNPDYKKWYGSRGITVCEEWKNNFEAFYNWAISHGYKDELTIDRIDNNGDYTPLNCRWVTMKEQCKNKRKRKTNELFAQNKTQ